MDVKLVAETGPCEGQAVKITDKLFIGTHPNCRLRPALRGIGGVHALIEQRGEMVFVRDFGCELETRVNGALLNTREREVFDGDRLDIGPMGLTFRIKSRDDEAPAWNPPPEGWPCVQAAPPEALQPKPTIVRARTPESKRESIPFSDAGELERAVRYERRSDKLLVTLINSDLDDETTVAPARFGLQRLADLELSRKVVIDLSRVEHMSSRAVGVILAYQQRVKAAGGTLRFAAAGAKVEPVLKQMRLHLIADGYPTAAEALDDPWE